MISQKLKEIELKIETASKDIKPRECISFLEENQDQIEHFSNYLFNLKGEAQSDSINQTKREITKEIVKSRPAYLKEFLKPLFNTSSKDHDKSIHNVIQNVDDIKSCFFTKNNKESISELAEILQQIICKPLNLFTKIFLYNDPKLREKLEQFLPEVYQNLDEEISRLQSTIESYKKNCYIPIVDHQDSTNPRVSKFGGVLPYLPIDGPPICRCGQDKFQTVFSLFVSTLPCEMKNLFPEGHEYVVVGYTCEKCYLVQRVKCYVDNEIDQLVYDDVPSDDRVFNEPRTVIGWKKSSMFPTSIKDKAFKFGDKSDEEMFFLERILANLNRSEEIKNLRTYLGGHPYFVQADDRPDNHVLLLEMEASEASTSFWGDCGTAQVWMTTGKDFGSFALQFACF